MHATICGDDGELNHLIGSRNRSKYFILLAVFF